MQGRGRSAGISRMPRPMKACTATLNAGSQRGRSHTGRVRPARAIWCLRLNTLRVLASAVRASHCCRRASDCGGPIAIPPGIAPGCRPGANVRPRSIACRSPCHECFGFPVAIQPPVRDIRRKIGTGDGLMPIEFCVMLTDIGRRKTVKLQFAAVARRVRPRAVAQLGDNEGGRPECMLLRPH